MNFSCTSRLLLLVICGLFAGCVDGPAEGHVRHSDGTLEADGTLEVDDTLGDGVSDAEGVSDADDRVLPNITGGWLLDGDIDTPALTDWLRRGQYRFWTSSSGVFPTPQGGSRVFLNPILVEALANGAQPPAGAIGVRELYENDLVTLKTVNILVKLEEDKGDGEGTLWVELADFRPGAVPTINQRAAPACLSCHAADRTMIKSSWPLR